MSTNIVEKNKAVVRRFVEEVWNEGDLDAADEVLAETYIEHPSTPPPGNGDGNGQPDGEEAVGPAPMKEFVRMFRGAFPDMKFTIAQMVAEGDKVAVHLVGNGTHLGELHGMPPSGKRVTIGGAAIHRLENEKIAETFQVVDRLALRMQIGAPDMGDIDVN